MLAKTHVIGGIAASLGVATVTNFDPVLMTGAAAVGALLPDIDHGGSKAGRELPIISWIFSNIFGHRTFSHSILFLVLVGWGLSLLPIHKAIIAGILVGMISHLLLDAITKQGIKLFYPLPIRFGIPLFRTGKLGEKFVALGLLLLSLYWAADLITF